MQILEIFLVLSECLQIPEVSFLIQDMSTSAEFYAIGNWVEDGEFPNDMETLEEIVKGISYNNAINYFGFDLTTI